MAWRYSTLDIFTSTFSGFYYAYTISGTSRSNIIQVPYFIETLLNLFIDKGMYIPDVLLLIQKPLTADNIC